MQATGLFRRANVLAVDDQPANLVALEAVLGSEYEVIRAVSGPQALEILERRGDIDLILMDVQMPIMDGFEAAARIKTMPGCEDIPVVFITAVYNEDPFIKQGYKVGAVDYFSKPFDPQILKVKVGIYASFRQRADVLRERARQVQASEELLKVGRKLSTLLREVRLGIVIADGNGRITQTNEEVFRIWKSIEAPNAEFPGEILGWWDSEGRLVRGKPGPLARALESGESTHNECLEILGAGGIAKTVCCSASPLRALDGRIVGAILVVQDMTESTRVQRDMEQRIAGLAAARMALEAS